MLNSIKHKIVEWMTASTNEHSMSVNKIDEFHDLSSYTLTIIPASGGTCVKFFTYDPATHSGRSSLYVVSDSEKLEDAIRNIVISERLKHAYSS
jgi:hypothetical protein